jgi:SAM-dependent methyltransferase
MQYFITLLKFLLPTRLYRLCRYVGCRWFGFVCPICHEPAWELGVFGVDDEILRQKKVVAAGVRKVVCPSCKSTDRERLVYLYLKRRLANKTQQRFRILHIAPEPNILKTIKSMSHVFYVTADFCKPPADLHFDLVKAPFPDCTFDAIICNHVLQEIPDDRAAMEEIRRILRPRGWAVLQVPLSHVLEDTFEDPGVTSPWSRVFKESHYVRMYSPRDYKRRLEACGLQLTTQGSRQIGVRGAHKLGLAPGEEIYCVVKNDNSARGQNFRRNGT